MPLMQVRAPLCPRVHERKPNWAPSPNGGLKWYHLILASQIAMKMRAELSGALELCSARRVRSLTQSASLATCAVKVYQPVFSSESGSHLRCTEALRLRRSHGETRRRPTRQRQLQAAGMLLKPLASLPHLLQKDERNDPKGSHSRQRDSKPSPQAAKVPMRRSVTANLD